MIKVIAATGLLAYGLLVSSAHADEMTFELVGTGGNCSGCEWTKAEGRITEDTPAKLREYLDTYGSGFFVFNSPGGNLVAGLEMGTMIREADSGTAIGISVADDYGYYEFERAPGRCASACAFAFLGGTHRELQAGELGIHQFYDGVSMSRPDEPIYSALDLSINQIISSLLINYAFEMGVDPRFISKASSVPPSGMHWLTEDEIREWKVRYDPSSIGEWRIEPWRDGIVAFAKSADELTTATVFCGQSGTPQLMVSTPYELYEGSSFIDPTEYLTSISVFGKETSVDEVAVRHENGRYTLRIQLPGFDTTSLPSSGTIEIEADVPRAYMGMFRYPMQAERAAEHIGAALRNCV
ncbi:MAG: hypothetical protein ACT6QU_14735 [Aliihoeflea sp.]|uniref:hypothetical protein n=1 Tax=Aliihoeflea sp. TaxID=2608088 RepID=UPI004034D9D8